MPQFLPIHRFEPVGEAFIGPTLYNDPRHFDGKFYQPVDAEACQQRRQAIGQYLADANTLGLMPVGLYQDWVELDWKAPHGTREAFERFGDKLIEEGGIETVAEFKILPSPTRQAEGKVLNSEKAMDELGDTLWVTTALASNSGVDVQQALSEYLHHNELAATRRPEIAICELDYVVAAGHIPLLVKPPFMDVDITDPFIHEDEMNPIFNLIYRTHSLKHQCDRQFGYGDDDTFVQYSWFKKTAQEIIAPIVADHVIMIAYYAQVWGKSTLAAVIANNVNKVSARADANLIDKSDGDRNKL